MEIKRYLNGKDGIEPSQELADRATEYMSKHKVSYSEASAAVLQLDPELAEAYALGDQRNYKAEAEVKDSKYSDPKPRARQMSDYQQGLEASKEIARKAEIKMLELDCDYMRAQSLVLAENPELLKAYTQEIVG